MKGDDNAERLRWRALTGTRVAELLRHPEEPRTNAFQSRELHEQANRAFPAGLQTPWGEVEHKGVARPPRTSWSTQVAERLTCWSEEPDTTSNASKLGCFQRRNSSRRVYDIIHRNDDAQEAPGVLGIYGTQGLYVDSANLRPGQSLKRQIVPTGRHDVGEILEHRFVSADSSSVLEKEGRKAQSAFPRDQHDIHGIIHHSYMKEAVPVERPQHRSSYVHPAGNPCRWGVDVLNYQLPEPRRPRGTAIEENLGTGLIPKRSFDEPPSASKRNNSTACRYIALGHLEPSTLYPLESASQKFTQEKRKSELERNNLDQTCTPYEDEQTRHIRRPTTRRSQSHLQAGFVPSEENTPTRKRCNESWHVGNLRRDLMPQPFDQERTGRRRQPTPIRDLLQKGSMMPQ